MGSISINHRSVIIDLLKGWAIIAVVLYHSSLFTYGYLGVDIFLVIAGYLTTKTILKQCQDGREFKIGTFLLKRLIRLWPLVLFVCVVTLFLACLWMMPMALKNTAETVGGSTLFLNNIVQYITSSNYWDQSNDFKPLMHTWYLALLFQYYIFYALLLYVVIRYNNNKKLAIKNTIFILFFISLFLYITPIINIPQKFYLLPARLFEFAAGGILVLLELKLWHLTKEKIAIFLLVLIILILCLNYNLGIEQIRLLSVVLITQILIYYTQTIDNFNSNNLSYRLILLLSYVGIGSYSLYLWHQVVLGFYRYVFNNPLIWSDYIIIFSICLLLSIISYQLFEKRLTTFLIENNIIQRYCLLACCMVSIVLVFCSAYIYKKQGLIRDVPELNLYVGSNKNMSPEEYNSSNFSFDVDFPENDKKNALVIGDSFARDWINILKESHADSILNISYHTEADSIISKRIKEADFVFVANNGDFDVYYPFLREMMKKKFYRVGGKYFTKRVGIVYNNNRYGIDYYNQSFVPNKELEEIIDNERTIFGNSYIEMMSIIMDNKGNYPHFTPDHHLYSEDGIHLTQPGAKEYAKRLNVWQYLEE